MPTVSYYSENIPINSAISGLGFYGASFAYSVAVGEYNQTTWITNADGTAQGPQVNNIKFANIGSGYIESALVPTGLRYIPNQDASLNIRVSNASAIVIQNAAVKCYDRVSSANAPSGVTTYVAEVVHPSTSQLVTGSGNITWTVFSGVNPNNTSLSLSFSPGATGVNGGRYTTNLRSDVIHDWYLCLSPSPDSIGSKTDFGLYFSYEYL